MLLIIFGYPGAGKNYVANVLTRHFGFAHYDADIDLTPELIETIQQKSTFTQSMRDRYFTHVIEKMKIFDQKHELLVVTQALAKESNRTQIAKAFPKAQFIWVQSQIQIADERLKARNDWVDPDYAHRIRAIFEAPSLPHLVIENNFGEFEVLEQLKTITYL